MESYLPVFLAFGLMMLAVPVPICLLAGTFLYFGVISPTLPLTSVIQNIVNQSMATGMLAAPLFIIAGEIMNYSGITARLLDFCDCLLGHKEGGLAYINVLLSTLNGGMCGSATADAALQCRILVPEMEKKGYPRAFSTAVTAASSLITPIIPPGVPLILYGIMTGVSVGKMWVAGYVPGIMLCIGMMFVRPQKPLEKRPRKKSNRKRTSACHFKLGLGSSDSGVYDCRPQNRLLHCNGSRNRPDYPLDPDRAAV